MKKRFLSRALILCMLLSALPITPVSVIAMAAEKPTEKNIMLGASHIEGAQASNVYFGTYQQSSDGNGGYNVDPIKWRVLSNNENSNGKLFLLSDQNLDVFEYHKENEAVTWETSTMRSWLNGLANNKGNGENAIDYTNDNFLDTAFSASEQTAIADTTTDKVFLLSIEEVQNTAYGFTANTDSTDTRKSTNTAYVADGGKIGSNFMKGVGEADFWWLRSPGNNTIYAPYVFDEGYVGVNGDYVNFDLNAVRPAFNINLSSVLFTSAAKGGKSSTAVAGGEAGIFENVDISTLTDNDGYKLTLLDSNRNAFTATLNSISDNIVTVSYSGANTGDNEYISAIIKNGDVVKYYGRLGLASESGTATVTLPDDFNAANGDVLCIFNEQYNGDYKTDYASELKEMPIYGVAFDANGGTGTMNSVIATGTYTLPANDFTAPSGYQFKGWATTKDGTVISNTAITVTDHTTLYAIWAAPPAEAPTVTAGNNLTLTYKGYTDEWVSVSVSEKDGYTYSYQWYDGNDQPIGGATNGAYPVPSDLTVDSYSYYCRVTAKRKDNELTNFADSAKITVTVNKAEQNAPTGILGTAETIDGKADGKITGVTATMEYRKESDTTYTAISGTEITNLSDGKYYVRYKADANRNASADTEVTIAKGRKLTVTVPTTQVGYTLTVNKTELVWNDSVELNFALANGYSKLNNFAVNVNGNPISLDTNGKCTVPNAQSDITVTVIGVADITAPTGEIKLGTNSWKAFLNNITFGLFFKDTQEVTITANDNSGEAVKIEYLLSNKELTAAELATATFTSYSDKFNINPNNEYVIYAKLTDNSDNVTYINSNGIVLDNIAPVISGIVNGNTYCEAQTVTVRDKYEVTVTVNDEPVTLTNGTFTLSPAEGTQKIIVKDRAGNVSAEMIVTVNDGHETDTPATCKKAVCKHCGVEYGEVDNSNHSNLNHYTEKAATVNTLGNIEYWYCDGCDKYFTDADCKNEIESVEETYLYAVIFNTDGGNPVEGKYTVKWHDKVLDGITAPTKDGYEFIDWKYGTAHVTESTEYKALVANKSTASVELTTQWKDITAPTGEIKLGTNSWKAFLNNITFGLFFKDTQEVTITANDNSGEAVKIEYLLSNKELTAAELATATFTSYSDKFNINPNNEYVIYAKLTDKTGNVTYINSNGIVLDNIAPVISGIVNGNTYCEAQTVTVSDKYEITVTVNGTPVTLDANGQFTLSPASGTQTVVATDKAGNVSAEMIVTVNDGHTYEWKDGNGQYWQKCKFCGDETDKKDIPGIIINGADKVCVTQGYSFTVTVSEGATDVTYGYEFTNKSDGGIEPKLESGIYFDTIPSNILKDDTSFTLVVEATTVDGYLISTRKDIQILSEHTGGTATCTEKAKCEVCGEEYGEVDNSNHDLENIKGSAATVTETGNIEYWHCEDCNKYFSDKDGKNVIDLKDTVISKLAPEIIDGKGQSLTAGETRELTFRSNAAYSDFIRVEVDGETVDEKNYTVKEGSTIVTLKADYVATLSAGEHTLGIVSQSGTATTTFTVNAKVVNDNTSPATGDNSHMALWFALLFVSGGLLTVAGVCGKKRKYSAK